jgi:hypothetical protein
MRRGAFGPRVTALLALVLTFCLSPGPARAQDTAADAAGDPADPVADLPLPEIGALRGRLLQRGARAPLVGVLVTLARDGDDPCVVFSDAEGRIRCDALAPGWWTVEVEEPDLASFRSSVEVTAGEVVEVTWFVEVTDGDERFTATVTTDAVVQDVTRRAMTVADIQRAPGNNNDAIRAVENLAGVGRAPFASGAVIIRGSAPRDTSIVIDGMILPGVFHFGGLRTVVPSELLAELNFLPGGQSAYYGRTTSGVVEVVTRQDAPERLSGHVDLNLFDTGVWLQAPLSDRVSLEVGARRSYIDLILQPLAQDLGLAFDTAPRYADGQVRLMVRPDDRNRFSLMVLGSDDRFSTRLTDERALHPDDRGGVTGGESFVVTQARWDRRVSARVDQTTQVQHVAREQSFDGGENQLFAFTLQGYSARHTTRWRASERLLLRHGFDMEGFVGSGTIASPRFAGEGEIANDLDDGLVVRGSRDVASWDLATFADATLRPIDRLQLVPGVRAELHPERNAGVVEPRFAARYALLDGLAIKGSAGRFTQQPEPLAVVDIYGNPDLGLERANQYTLGLDGQTGAWAQWSVELFGKTMDQLTASTDREVVRNGETVPLVYDNIGSGRAVGAEVSGRFTDGRRTHGSVAWTVSRSERRDRPDGPWRLFDFDQTHILTTLAQRDLPQRWSVGARFRLVTGNPTTPVVDAVFDQDAYRFARVAGPINSARVAAFHQLDVRVDKTWLFDRSRFTAYLDIQNVYNRRNAEGVRYNYDFSQSTRAGGLPFLPSLGLRWSY